MVSLKTELTPEEQHIKALNVWKKCAQWTMI